MASANVDNNVLDDVRELGGIAAKNVGEVAMRLREQGGELLENGKRWLKKVQVDLKRYMTSNSRRIALIALGVGACNGFLIRRSTRA